MKHQNNLGQVFISRKPFTLIDTVHF